MRTGRKASLPITNKAVIMVPPNKKDPAACREATGSGTKGNEVPVMRVLIITLLAVLVFAAPASAVTVVSSGYVMGQFIDRPNTEMTLWANESRVALPNATVETDIGRCPEADTSCVFRNNEGRLVVLLAANTEPQGVGKSNRPARWWFMRELSHLLSDELSVDQRRAFQRLVGSRQSTWSRALPRVHDPDQRFADAFASCAWQLPADWPGERPVDIGYWPTRRMHKRVCRYMRAVGRTKAQKNGR